MTTWHLGITLGSSAGATWRGHQALPCPTKGNLSAAPNLPGTVRGYPMPGLHCPQSQTEMLDRSPRSQGCPPKMHPPNSHFPKHTSDSWVPPSQNPPAASVGLRTHPNARVNRLRKPRYLLCDLGQVTASENVHNCSICRRTEGGEPAKAPRVRATLSEPVTVLGATTTLPPVALTRYLVHRSANCAPRGLRTGCPTAQLAPSRFSIPVPTAGFL